MLKFIITLILTGVFSNIPIASNLNDLPKPAFASFFDTVPAVEERCCMKPNL